jgi:hypothetical protein
VVLDNGFRPLLPLHLANVIAGFAIQTHSFGLLLYPFNIWEVSALQRLEIGCRVGNEPFGRSDAHEGQENPMDRWEA